MKSILLNLTIAVACCLPLSGLAQGTYLNAPNGGPTNALVVDSAGQIGIGTTEPRTRLEVQGEVSVSLGNVSIGNGYWYCGASSRGPAQPLIRSEGMGLFPTDYPGLQLGQTNDHIALFIDPGSVRGNSFSGNANEIVTPNELHILQADRDGADWIHSMAFRNGNVGIGTTTPSSKLHVLGGRATINGVDLGEHIDNAYVVEANGMINDLVLRAGGNYTSGGFVYIKANGNVGIGTTAPQSKLEVNGKVNCTVLELTSDRAQKSGFAPVDRRAILDQVTRLPITTWHYTNEPTVRHLGPVAQDFKAAFNLGSDDKRIATVDADGVLFAALQGLNQKLEAELQAKDARITALEKELATLRTGLASRLTALEKQLAGSSPVPVPSASNHPLVESAAQR